MTIRGILRLMVMVAGILIVATAAFLGVSPAQGNSPEITFIDFPEQIPADGSEVTGYVGFEDPDGDLAKAEFEVVQAVDLQPFTVEPAVEGLTKGVFSFTLFTTTPQEVTLRLTLIDEAGNRSEPKEFSFRAGGAVPPPSPSPPSGTPYADRVVSFQAGTGANQQWGDPADALGPPDFRLNPSSGLVNLGIGGVITLEFTDNEIIDRPGNDIRIWGDPENDELIKVEVSADGVTYRSLGTVGEMADLDLSASGLTSAKFIRITDDGSTEQSEGPSPGAELDAVAALPAPGTPYADLVVSYQPGPYAESDFSYPLAAVGPPDLTFDPPGGFVDLGVGGSIILEFWDNIVTDGPGDDLRIWGDPDNDEQIQVEASIDGSDYRSFGLVGEMATLDLAQVGLSSARFIRIIDDDSREQVGTESIPGAELDAVEALHSE